MALTRKQTPDRLEYRESPGVFLFFFGLPFLLSGLATMVAPLWAEGGGDVPSWAFSIPFGSIFAAVGACMTVGRRGVIMDKRAGRMRKWWGFLVPWVNKDHALADFRSVRMNSRLVRTKNGSYTVFTVLVEGANGTVEVGEDREFHASRRMAEEVAKFLKLEVRDNTGDTEVVRPWDALDQSVREQIRCTGKSVEVPAKPARMTTVATVNRDRADFQIPAQRMKAAVLLIVLPFLFVGAFIALGVGGEMMDASVPMEVKVFLGVVLGGFFLVLPTGVVLVMLARSALGAARVEVTRERLRVVQKGLLAAHTVDIPADELEELVVGRPPGSRGRMWTDACIMARSDRVCVELGGGLPMDELTWMRACMLRVLAG